MRKNKSGAKFKFKPAAAFVIAAAALFAAFGCALLQPIIPETAGYLSGAPVGYERIERPEYDYFSSVFGLGDGHVFRTLSFGSLYKLLAADDAESGDYPIVIGAQNSPLTKGAVSLIDAAARERGVRTVYYFDMYLDGALSGALSEQYRVDRFFSTTKIKTLLELINDALPEKIVLDGDGALLLAVAKVAGTKGVAGNKSAAAGFDARLGAVGTVKEKYLERIGGFLDDLNAKTADFEDESGLTPVTFPELAALLGAAGEHAVLFGSPAHAAVSKNLAILKEAAAGYAAPVYWFDPVLSGLAGDSSAFTVGDTGAVYAYLFDTFFAEYRSAFNTAGSVWREASGASPLYADKEYAIGESTYSAFADFTLLLYNKDAGGKVIASAETDRSASETADAYLRNALKTFFDLTGFSYNFLSSSYTLQITRQDLDTVFEFDGGSGYYRVGVFYDGGAAAAAFDEYARLGYEPYYCGGAVCFGDAEAVKVKSGIRPAGSASGGASGGGANGGNASGGGADDRSSAGSGGDDVEIC
ncbi:MAG: hypothetical protein LBL66_02560 [Clostridiales bacterium]|jgi:hypothetical protein|nr:hypothetical protein [Clostridiales bacterium]